VAVLKCQKSEVLLLSQTDHMNMDYYNEKESFKYWGADDRKAAILSCLEDTERRVSQWKTRVANKKVVDVGTGTGSMLDAFSPYAKTVSGVEPQLEARKNLQKLGYSVTAKIEELPDNEAEVISLFHVLEHFTNPLKDLQLLKEKNDQRWHLNCRGSSCPRRFADSLHL
jgi:2-polyprenyl-3-methyl-5-hydroxy-6-metoxy-1,4-benzoquinol methylase